MDKENNKIDIILAKKIAIRDQYGERHVLSAAQWLLHAWFRSGLKKN